jgi:predicted nucleic acid-binding protein
MNVVDSSGWIEYFTKGVNGHIFLPVLQDTKNLLVPTICVYEVFKRIASLLSEEDALTATGIMSLGQIIEIDLVIAISAAQISLEYKLAMADSLILACARAHNATLWTQDEHFKDIPGVQYIEKQ